MDRRQSLPRTTREREEVIESHLRLRPEGRRNKIVKFIFAAT